MALNDRDIERVIQDALELEQAWLTELAQLLLQHLQAGEWSELDEIALLELQAELERKVTTVNAKHQDDIQSGISEAVIETLLAAAASDIYGLKSYYKQEPEPILEPKLTSIANQVAQGVSNTIRRRNIAMSDSAVRAWYTAAIQAMQDIQQNGLSFDRAISKAVESLGRSFRIRYASGKTTSPDVALRRLMTTEMSQAGGRMTLECMESYGHELAVTSTHYGARPSHAVWQGKPFGIHGAVTVDGVDYPGMEELTDYGSVTGLKGVNCRHSIYPYYPGITELPDRDFEAEKAKWGKSSNEFYEATQRQRELERRIRSSKGVIADMEQAGLGLESPDYVQKRLVLGRQQRELKAFLSKNNLPRQPLREKAYGVAKQPRGLFNKQRAITARRKAIVDKFKGRSKDKSTSEIDLARDVNELQDMLEKKHGVRLVNVNEVEFEKLRKVCAGVDEVFSDFLKAKSWTSVEGRYYGNAGTICETAANGTLFINAGKIKDKDGFYSTGRHEAGHLLELAMAENNKGDTYNDYESAKYSRLVLKRALRKMNADTGRKVKLEKAIEKISFYPFSESYLYNDSSAVLHAEALACAIENIYNKGIRKGSFESYIFEELVKELQ